MLKKLIKYEWKATSRILLPLYGAIILLALINRLIWIPMDAGRSISTFGFGADLVAALTMTVYIGLMVAAFVITFIILIQRFYKSLLGDEGYLMFTLPVTAKQNIGAKMIVATIMNILSCLAALISILVLASSVDMWQAFFENFGEFLQEFFSNANYPLYFIELVALLIISTVGSMLGIYLCIAIGHLARRHRIAASIGAYFGLSIIGQMLMTFLFRMVDWVGLSQWINNTNAYTVMHVGMLTVLIITTLISAICFFITDYILNNHLNLE